MTDTAAEEAATDGQADDGPPDGRPVRVGVDVGGTFTDVVTVAGGRVRVHKTPSTPDAPEEGVLAGLEMALDEPGLAPGAVRFFGHGTTVATNAVLEGEWAETALLTTAGFRDVLEIGRQTRPDIYDFRADRPDPIVPRHRRLEVAERVDERGRVRDPLSPEAAREAVEAVPEGVDSVAVCLLFAFESDAHERRLAEAIAERRPDVSVSVSADVLPEIREYERTVATALNAALKPVVDAYLGEVDAGIRAAGVSAPLRVMQSNGGLAPAADTRERPVTTLLSGPAAGVRGAAHVAGRQGVADAITMDMGGTSCDVAVVDGGDPVVTTDTTVGDYPVAVPSVDVHTVGAGGGSIARLDEGDALRVGPRSAGADPGPVCYGRGGTAPTVTDAHLVLGRIDPTAFSGDVGAGVDEATVRESFADLAAGLDVDVRGAARGVVDVANANMERALRVVSLERGYDPRAFALVAFGGAGPLHAPALAAALSIPRVLVPRAAGVLSALGLLVGDVTYDYGASRVRRLDAVDPADLETHLADFEREGRERLVAEGFEPAEGDGDGDGPARRDRSPEAGEIGFERTLSCRYVGQSHDLRVPAPTPIDAAALDTVADRFHERHRRRYGHADPDEPVEVVTLRVRARGLVEPPGVDPPDADGTVADARRTTRPVGGGALDRVVEAPVYDRSGLPAGGVIDGPAVVEGVESTTVVPTDQRARVADDGTLVVEVDP
jgi:N-methylhydantoinase A